ncbi:MAG TPA: hypothetical protein VGB59_00315 [Allosphingosinicella sp.]|jgi:hypothetical protein
MGFAKIIGAAAVAAALAAPSVAQDSGWRTLGRAPVNPEATSGTINVRWDPNLREAMFCVDGHGVRLTDATLRLQDGSAKLVKIRQTLADGGCSKALPLPRKADVASVDIAYDSASLGGAKAKVQLTAR